MVFFELLPVQELKMSEFVIPEFVCECFKKNQLLSLSDTGSGLVPQVQFLALNECIIGQS